MYATFKTHGARWLIFIFLFIILAALTFMVRLLVIDMYDLHIQVEDITVSNQLLQESALATQTTAMSMKDDIDTLKDLVAEQDRLITELESVVNHTLNR